MKATDRYKARRAERLDTTDVFGDGEREVATYLPLATGILSEAMKKRADARDAEDAKKKLESTDAYKAQQDAERARKLANDAAADALTEQNPNGPKHLAAQQAQLAYLAASQKAAFYGSAPAGMQGPQPPPHESTLFTPRNVAIGVGALGVVGLVVFLARR